MHTAWYLFYSPMLSKLCRLTQRKVWVIFLVEKMEEELKKTSEELIAAVGEVCVR